jgi:hypothetical protein
MSFICKVCGPVANLEKQTKVPTKVRDVEYQLQVKTVYADGESIKTVRKTRGTEIVEETAYCIKHLPTTIEPIKVAKATRDQIIKTISTRKNNEDMEETPKGSNYAKEKRNASK